MNSLKPDAHIFNLAITNGDDRLFVANAFVEALSNVVGPGRKIETIVLDDRSSEAEVRTALERANRADIVIASLYGRVRSGQARSVGLPEPGATALGALVGSRMRLVGVSFGNPYLLQSFPGLQTYVVAYGDMPSLQQAVARALVGQIDISGKLPISLPGLYPRGTGIQLKRAQ
jgi:beta-N-acetylhexosaminidase